MPAKRYLLIWIVDRRSDGYERKGEMRSPAAAYRRWCHGQRAEELAGVAGLSDSIHHLTREDHGEREGMTANATRAMVRASKHKR